VEIPGANIKVRVNTGGVLKVTRANIADHADTGDVTNSEQVPDANGVIKRKIIPVRGSCRLTLNDASYDPAENPYGQPVNLVAGATVKVEVFPDGLDDPNPWLFPTCVVADQTHDFDVNMLQPLSFTLEVSDTYYRPGETP
jgi:hypothetical protein